VSARATGVGSWPGENVREATRIVFDVLTDLPHVPELPSRGPGADMIGRSASLLVEIPVEAHSWGWRLAQAPGRDYRRAVSLLGQDLDAVEETGDGFTGVVKTQVAGPWTLAAAIKLASGHRVLRDPGAVRDLAQSLAEGVRLHVEDLQRRLPGAQILLQVDEPSLPAVLGGRIAGFSGLSHIAPVEASVVESTLAGLVAQVGHAPVLHCCSSDVPFALIQRAGFVAASFDLSVVGTTSLDAIGESAEAGLQLWPGVVPTSPAVGSDGLDTAAMAADIRTLWARLGFAAEAMAEQVVVTPACGLAVSAPAYARSAITASVEIAHRLTEDPEGR
jgi:Cobalamin-independent synthase, Catalytic domain